MKRNSFGSQKSVSDCFVFVYYHLNTVVLLSAILFLYLNLDNYNTIKVH